MVAQPASVPAARRFVAEALNGWGHHAFADAVGLCVSELATNATLHSGSSYFHIELEAGAGAVRVAVADTGMEPVDLLAHQPELSDAVLTDLNADETSATGRGIFLVATLATAWGIDELPAGKRVWAEFHPEADGADPSSAQVTWSPQRPAPTSDPGPWVVVGLRSCPAAMLVLHDDNLAEYTRELQLIGDRIGEPSFQRLAAQLTEYVAQNAATWEPARIIAHQAVREGRELVDIDVMATPRIRQSLQLRRQMVTEAETLSRQGRLMTLPAPEPVQRLRDWLEGEFLAQVEDGAAPLPYPDWLAGARHRPSPPTG